MKEVTLSNTLCVVIVDNEDYDFIKAYGSWNLDNKGYARVSKMINKIRKTIRMHRLIAERMEYNISTNTVVDHINRNKLDNRRCNLRVVSRSQNGANSSRNENQVGYRGVYKNYDKWVAQISINGKVKHLGRFDSAQQAAKAYNKTAIEYFGDCAVLNL